MAPTKDPDSGKFEEQITPNDVINAFDTVRGPAVTPRDVAEACDCHKATARRKLDALEEAGSVQHRNTSTTTLWWRV